MATMHGPHWFTLQPQQNNGNNNKKNAPQQDHLDTRTHLLVVSGCDGTEVAVSRSIARACRELCPLLDALDLSAGRTPTVDEAMYVAEKTTGDALCRVMRYLELRSIRIPTVLGRPLAAASIWGLIQPWEAEFLRTECTADDDAIRHRPMLEVMAAAELLGIESLSSLTGAAFASLVLECGGSVEQLSMMMFPAAASSPPPTSDEVLALFGTFPCISGAAITPTSGSPM